MIKVNFYNFDNEAVDLEIKAKGFINQKFFDAIELAINKYLANNNPKNHVIYTATLTKANESFHVVSCNETNTTSLALNKAIDNFVEALKLDDENKTPTDALRNIEHLSRLLSVLNESVEKINNND